MERVAAQTTQVLREAWCGLSCGQGTAMLSSATAAVGDVLAMHAMLAVLGGVCFFFVVCIFFYFFF